MSSYPLLDAFLTIFWFTLMALWFVILIVVILEIFHNRDIGGWGKAGWLLLVTLLPLIGVLAYVIVYGHRMGMGAARQGYGADTPPGTRANELSGSPNRATAARSAMQSSSTAKSSCWAEPSRWEPSYARCQ